jgi:hypothetical protein
VGDRLQFRIHDHRNQCAERRLCCGQGHQRAERTTRVLHARNGNRPRPFAPR